MTTPLVSFVVPCYKLAHYLPNCIDSILGQANANVELIVMDDHSPDDTEAVAARYASDPRVKYVRNDPNLGHLRNYNKGIGLATGKYVWLISADDCLRAKDAVERFVGLMEANPKISYAFCSAMELSADDREVGIVQWARPFAADATIPGPQFMRLLAEGNCVCAPSVMVRRSCYETSGLFPLDLPHAGDWYLWCAFAAIGDVAFVAEPLVCYRVHGANMSLNLLDKKMALVRADQNGVRWRLKEMAERAGLSAVADACLERLAHRAAVDLAGEVPAPSPEKVRRDIEALPERQLESSQRKNYIASVVRQAADQLYQRGDFEAARSYYRAALEDDPRQHAVRAKLLLARLGPAGRALRDAVRGLRTPKAAG